MYNGGNKKHELSIKAQQQELENLKIRANSVLNKLQRINADDLSEAQIAMLESAVDWKPGPSVR